MTLSGRPNVAGQGRSDGQSRLARPLSQPRYLVPFVVTGISQDGDTAALEQALKSAGLSLEVFEVLGPDDADEIASGGHIDTAIITGSGLESGTGVPGLTNSGVPGVTSAPRIGGGTI